MELQTYNKLFEELSPDRQALMKLVYTDERIKQRDWIVLKIRDLKSMEKDLLNE